MPVTTPWKGLAQLSLPTGGRHPAEPVGVQHRHLDGATRFHHVGRRLPHTGWAAGLGVKGAQVSLAQALEPSGVMSKLCYHLLCDLR